MNETETTIPDLNESSPIAQLEPKQCVIHLSSEEKMQLLTGYLKKNTELTHVLVYINSAYLAQKTATWLKSLGIETLSVVINTESDRSEDVKLAEQKWLSGEVKVAVGTDMSFKTWPNQQAQLLIHFELPKYHHHYQERLQKLTTQKQTESIGFCAFEDCEYLLNIEHSLKHKIAVQELDESLLEKNLGEEPSSDQMPNRMDFSKISAKGLKATARDSWHRKDQDNGVADKWDKNHDRNDRKRSEPAAHASPRPRRAHSDAGADRPPREQHHSSRGARAEHKPRPAGSSEHTPMREARDGQGRRPAHHHVREVEASGAPQGETNPYRVDRFTDPDYLRYLESKGKKAPERRPKITPLSATNKQTTGTESGTGGSKVLDKVKKWFGLSSILLFILVQANLWASVMPSLSYDIYQPDLKKNVTLTELVANNSLLFVGEQHDQMNHHFFKVALLQEALSQGKQVTVVLEYLPQDFDSLLIKYNGGLLGSFQNLVDSINWEKVWGYRSALQPFFDFLSSHPEVTVMASDLNRDLNRKIARQGFQNLSPAEQKQLSPILLSQALYRQWFDGVNPHPLPEPTATRYFESFIARNTVMAKRVIEVCQEAQNFPQPAQIFYFGGNGHLEYGLGVPDEVMRYQDSDSALSSQVLYLGSEEALPPQDDEIFKSDPQFGYRGDAIVHIYPSKG